MLGPETAGPADMRSKRPRWPVIGPNHPAAPCAAVIAIALLLVGPCRADSTQPGWAVDAPVGAVADGRTACRKAGHAARAAVAAADQGPHRGSNGDTGSRLSPADQLFLHVTSVANVYELLAAQIALEKAADPAVREFARMLVEHHSDSHAQLKRMAARRSVVLTTDTPLGKLQTIRQLATTQGAAFDLLFVQAVGIADHQESILLLESALRDTGDEELRAFAEHMLALQKAHLAAARTLQGGATPPAAASSPAR